jgi:hypothetical protein
MLNDRRDNTAQYSMNTRPVLPIQGLFLSALYILDLGDVVSEATYPAGLQKYFQTGPGNIGQL